MTRRPWPAPRSAEDMEAEIEDELREAPVGDRGSILLEGAHQLKLAGHWGSAFAMLERCLSSRPKDAAYARASMAQYLWELGRDAEAREHLRHLLARGADDVGPYLMTAELLVEQDDHREALRWFNLAVLRLPEDSEARLRAGELDDQAGYLLRQRAQVRRALDHPEDDLDRLVPVVAANRELARAEPAAAQASSRDRWTDDTAVPFWPRAELPLAHRRWPTLVPDDDADRWCRDLELDNRKAASEATTAIRMVPLSVAGLTAFAERWGIDPADGETGWDYAEQAAYADEGIPWPPPRNARCWCGSGRKYKHCCLLVR